jgi:hypothetical protein
LSLWCHLKGQAIMGQDPFAFFLDFRNEKSLKEKKLFLEFKNKL